MSKYQPRFYLVRKFYNCIFGFSNACEFRSLLCSIAEPPWFRIETVLEKLIENSVFLGFSHPRTKVIAFEKNERHRIQKIISALPRSRLISISLLKPISTKDSCYLTAQNWTILRWLKCEISDRACWLIGSFTTKWTWVIKRSESHEYCWRSWPPRKISL